MSQKPFSRTVQDIGNGCLGTSIPAELADQFDVEDGDELPLDFDRESGAVTFYLE